MYALHFSLVTKLYSQPDGALLGIIRSSCYLFDKI